MERGDRIIHCAAMIAGVVNSTDGNIVAGGIVDSGVVAGKDTTG